MKARLLICLSIVLSVLSLGSQTVAQTSSPTFPPLGTAFQPRPVLSTEIQDILLEYAQALDSDDHLTCLLYTSPSPRDA